MRSVLFGNDVIEIQESFGYSDSRLPKLMSEPLWKHGDLADVVGNEVGSPFKEILLHDFEFVLEKGSISESHFVGVAFEGSNVEFSAIVV